MCAGINDLEKFLHNKIVYKSHVLNVRHSFFFFHNHTTWAATVFHSETFIIPKKKKGH